MCMCVLCTRIYIIHTRAYPCTGTVLQVHVSYTRIWTVVIASRGAEGCLLRDNGNGNDNCNDANNNTNRVNDDDNNNNNNNNND